MEICHRALSVLRGQGPQALTDRVAGSAASAGTNISGARPSGTEQSYTPPPSAEQNAHGHLQSRRDGAIPPNAWKWNGAGRRSIARLPS